MGVLTPVPVAAEKDCDAAFLTFRPWHYGLTERKVVRDSDGKDRETCEFKMDFDGNDDIVAFVWIIILNIVSILFGIVGYLAIGFLIAGGYFYILARGDPSKIAKGKKTVVSAIVGLVICIMASLIANTIVNVLTGATA